MSDLHDLAPFYVLDALEPDEVGQFEAHLAECRRCQEEVRELSAGVDRLSSAVAEPAPPGLKDSVMAVVLADRSPTVTPLRRRRWASAIALVAAVVAVVTAVGIFRTTPQERLDDLLAAPDARTLAAEDGAAAVEVVFSPERGVAALISDSLPALDPDQTYEMWLIGAKGPVPAGLFVPDEDGRVIAFLDAAPAPGEVVGLTVEPAGGSPAPTGEILAAIPI